MSRNVFLKLRSARYKFTFHKWRWWIAAIECGCAGAEDTLAGAEHILGGVVLLQPTTYFVYIDIEVDINPFLFY